MHETGSGIDEFSATIAEAHPHLRLIVNLGLPAQTRKPQKIKTARSRPVDFYGPRLKRLQDCAVRDDDIQMNAAEALQAMIIHRDCHPAKCARQQAATTIIGMERSNVIPLTTAKFRSVGDVT